MDERLQHPTEPDRSADTVVGQLRDKRKRFQELLLSQRDQLGNLERALERQFERLQNATAIEAAPAPSGIDLQQFESQQMALATEAQSLAELSSELDARQGELSEFEHRLKLQEQTVVEQLARHQAELDERASELDTSGQQLRQAQRALAASEEELASDREQAARLRERLQEQVHAVEHERESLATRRSETNNQRRRIAKELQHQRQAQKNELAKEREAIRTERDALRAERDHLRIEHEQQVAEVNRRREESRLMAVANDEQLQEQLESSLSEAGELRRQLSEQKRSVKAKDDELESLRNEHSHVLEEIEALRVTHDRQTQELSRHQDDEGHADVEVERLKADIKLLRAQLAESENKVTAAGGSEADVRKREDLKRRFELAVEDIRDLKRRNAELEEQLAGARSGQPAKESAGGGKLDWESQKRRLLAELEADDDGDEEAEDRRMSIEGTIRITDEIVARKEQEIAELKRVLEEQSSNLGTVAIGASAIAEMLDQDDLVRQERENLSRIQDEWREKLRQAEIDISLERARMARERIEIDERMQNLESERQKYGITDGGKPGSKGEAGSAAQRRWWARLGLKEGDEK